MGDREGIESNKKLKKMRDERRLEEKSYSRSSVVGQGKERHE
uniref:Uncharacterized protein n=1 Tax=Nelumbo nucifera TaxID=4432 RepID=A0A822ZW04_NELNU|nr:TPA_asm: hypothetical protein HUJ06_017013 [Nelumbo nucifera]